MKRALTHTTIYAIVILELLLGTFALFMSNARAAQACQWQTALQDIAEGEKDPPRLTPAQQSAYSLYGSASQKAAAVRSALAALKLADGTLLLQQCIDVHASPYPTWRLRAMLLDAATHLLPSLGMQPSVEKQLWENGLALYEDRSAPEQVRFAGRKLAFNACFYDESARQDPDVRTDVCNRLIAYTLAQPKRKVARATPAPKRPACAVANADGRVIRQITPDYPDSARDLNIGPVTVTMKVTIGPSGALEGVALLHSSGNTDIDKAALDAARQSTYAPRRVNCKNVTGSYEFRADFNPN